MKIRTLAVAFALATATVIPVSLATETAQASTGLALPSEGSTIVSTTGVQTTFTVAMAECGQMASTPVATTGSCVASLQAMLRVFQDSTLPITGTFGDQTTRVTQAFQARHGMLADGRVGNDTRRVLLSEFVNEWGAQHPQKHEYSYTKRYKVKDSGSPELLFQSFLTNWKTVFPRLPRTNDCPLVLQVGLQCDLAKYGTGNVTITQIGSRHLGVRSRSGHAEGPNRDITFTFENTGTGIYLIIYATGPAPFYLKNPIGKAANNGVIDLMWDTLASNIRHDL